MRIPAIEGTICRRILVNFRVDPDVMRKHLPARFRPKLQNGWAIAGICLIRLEHLHPKILPDLIGFSSENAAHRVAVLWDDRQDSTCEGVYIPRRDTNSLLNHLLGGRVFPGKHHKATFKVRESEDAIMLAMKSADGSVKVKVAGRVVEELPSSSLFLSVEAASSFFEGGSLGYSATSDPDRLDGVRLDVPGWKVEPLDVSAVYSSYFADQAMFPGGSVVFDHALIMRNLDSEWNNAEDLYI